MYYSYGIGDCVHFLQFDCSGCALSVLSSLAQELPWLDEALSRWLSVFYCIWVDLSAYKEAALQSHPYWPSVSLVACVQFFSFPSDKNQLLPVFLKISQWNDLILMQVILRLGKSSLWPGILPSRHSRLPQLCAQFCLTSLERLRQGVSEAAVWLVTFYYGLWSLREGLGCPRLRPHQGVHQQWYGFHVSIPDGPATACHFPVSDTEEQLSLQESWAMWRRGRNILSKSTVNPLHSHWSLNKMHGRNSFQKFLLICIGRLQYLPTSVMAKYMICGAQRTWKWEAPFHAARHLQQGEPCSLWTDHAGLFEAWVQEAFAAGQFPASQQGEIWGRGFSELLELGHLDWECHSGPDDHREMLTLHTKSRHTLSKAFAY